MRYPFIRQPHRMAKAILDRFYTLGNSSGTLMVHHVEERLEITIDGMTAVEFPTRLHSTHCLMGIATLAEAVTLVAKLTIIERSEHLGDAC